MSSIGHLITNGLILDSSGVGVEYLVRNGLGNTFTLVPGSWKAGQVFRPEMKIGEAFKPEMKEGQASV